MNRGSAWVSRVLGRPTPGPEAAGPFPFGEGFRLYVPGADKVIAQYVKDTGWWAPFELRLLLPHLQVGDVAVDVGANIGTHAVPFARAVGPSGLVLAYEPDPSNRRLLRANLRLNRCSSCVVRPTALWDRPGTMMLHHSKGNMGAHSLVAVNVDDLQGSIPVKVTTLDAEARKWGGRRVRLIKMDTQGGEGHILRGAQRVIERDRPIVLAEFVGPMIESAGEPREVHLKTMEGKGYSLYHLHEGTQTIRPTTSETMRTVPDANDNNVLMVPSELSWRPAAGKIMG